MPYVDTSIIASIPDVIAEHGGDIARPFREVGIPIELTSHTQQVIAIRDYVALLEAAARETGDSHLGISLGEKLKIEDLGPFGRLVAGAPTLRRAIATTNALMHDFSPAMRTALEISGETAFWWSYEVSGVHDCSEGRRIDGELATLLFRTIIRLAAGPDWRPNGVLLPHGESARCRSFEHRFGVPVRGQGNRYAVILPQHLLDTPMIYSRTLGEPERRSQETALASIMPDESFAGLVRAFVRSRMIGGYPALSDVAWSTGLSERTFQRELAKAGLTYSEIVSSVRRDMAHDLLTDPSNSVLEVAMTLGYSDQANFTRAFKAWSGVTPGRYRRTADALRQGRMAPAAPETWRPGEGLREQIRDL